VAAVDEFCALTVQRFRGLWGPLGWVLHLAGYGLAALARSRAEEGGTVGVSVAWVASLVLFAAWLVIDATDRFASVSALFCAAWVGFAHWCLLVGSTYSPVPYIGFAVYWWIGRDDPGQGPW
jgi:hypothetical protein